MNTKIESPLTSLLQAEFQKSKKAGSAVVSAKKKEAFENFEKLGFPTTKNEEWKYTSLASILTESFATNANNALTKKDIEPLALKLEANVLVFVNGHFSKELSTILTPSSEVELIEIGKADSSIAENYFARKTYSSTDGLNSLNTAFGETGVCLVVKKNKAVALPFLLQNIVDARNENILAQPRNLIVVEENAQVSIIETFQTIGQQLGFTNAVTEIVLKKDAVVDYYKIQDDTSNSYHVGTTEILHEAKSVSTSTTITLGGAIVRNNLNITLNAEYCEAYLNGLYLLKGNQHVDNHTIADHAKANCYSNELYKGIMDDKSTGVFNGKIFVKQDAQKTNAFQSNKNVLLSKEATVNTKPQLEIFADDVKCSHGATTGQLDSEALFYLRSRGIGEAQAKRLLLHAFANDVLEKIKIEPLKELLKAKIEDRLQ